MLCGVTLCGWVLPGCALLFCRLRAGCSSRWFLDLFFEEGIFLSVNLTPRVPSIAPLPINDFTSNDLNCCSLFAICSAIYQL